MHHGGTIPIKRDISKPSRPPPAPLASQTNTVVDGLTARPARPKNRLEVTLWWKEVEFDKYSGLDEEKKPLVWFHGEIFFFFWLNLDVPN